MADLGHQLTDKELEQLEKRIAREYAIAAKDMRRKLRDYMEQFEEGKAAQKALLDAGKITKKEYQDWVYRHTMMGNQWRDMKNVLADDLKRASDIALRMSRDQMADIYALNANYAMFQIEHDFGIDTGFTLYNHDTAEYLLSEQRQLMPGPSARKAKEIAENKAMQWNKQKIQSAVLQGVLQGESPYDVAKRLTGVAQMGYNASVRYARTMTTSAQNAGRYNSYRRAKGLGVDLTIEWQATLDGRTRHEHRMMHGQRRDVDEPFEVDGFKILYPAQSDGPGSSDIPQSMIWNCFVGDTKVASDCEIVRSYKHKFKGNLIRVRTAAGVDFTCTPNHPILTPDGWVPAAFLHKGDHLLITRVGDDGSLTRNGNVYHVHSSIKALHDSLESLGNSERIPMSNFDFHGDVPTSDVEVVSKERLLRNDGNTRGGQRSRKIRFKLPNAFRLCERHFMLGFRRIYISSLRFVRGCCKPLTLIWRRLRHADIHGFGTVSNRDTCVSEYAINDLPTVTNIRSELLDGLAGNVFVDDVVSVDRKPGRLLCHVYNLQTESGYYFVGNSIPQNGEKYNGNYYAIAKNCRCTLLAWVKGFEGDTVKSSPKMAGMSFEEWQHAKEPKNPKAVVQPEPQKVTELSFADKIAQIKQRIADNGGAVTEADLQEAGKLLADDYNARAAENERLYNEKVLPLKEKYRESNGQYDKAYDDYWDKRTAYRAGKISKDELDAADAFLQKCKNERAEAFEKYNEASKKYVPKKKDQADWLKGKVGETREMGSSGFDIKQHLYSSKSKVVPHIEYAYDHYPKEWVEYSVKDSKLTPRSVARGHYSHWAKELYISGDGDSAVETALHELGHRFEYVVPGIKRAEKEFYSRRTDGSKLERLCDIFKGYGYGRDEVTRKDNFIHAYMGKDYGGDAYELVSMGFEDAYMNPQNLAKDPDMQSWIYGILLLI